MKMDAKEAVKLAKAWLASQYEDESISEIGLEEIRINEGDWDITLGFSRSWLQRKVPSLGLGTTIIPRLYKVLKVSDTDSRVVEMRNREAA